MHGPKGEKKKNLHAKKQHDDCAADDIHWTFKEPKKQQQNFPNKKRNGERDFKFKSIFKNNKNKKITTGNETRPKQHNYLESKSQSVTLQVTLNPPPKKKI